MQRVILAFGGVLLAVPLLAQTGTSRSQTTQNPSSQSTVNQNSKNQNTTNQNTTNQNATNQNANNQSSNQNNQKQNLSDLSARMLNNAMQAQDAVKNQNKQEALMYIGRASEDLNQIRSEQPRDKMIPVYSEVTDEWVLGPILAAHQNMNATHQGMNKTNQPMNSTTQSATAAQQSQQQNQPNQQQNQQPGSQSATNQSANSNDNLAVRRMVGQYTGMWLDTSGDQGHLQTARDAVNAGNFKAAAQELRAVQDSFVVESVQRDMPLLRARENLILAREAARRGDHSEEQAAIEAASTALAQYGQNGGRHSNEAMQLHQQMMTQASQSQISQDQINNWWNQVSNWTQPAPSRG